jgi:hypothetical protein
MEKISKSEIQAAIAEIQRKERWDIERAQMSQDARLWALRRDFRTRVQQLLVNEGLNIDKLHEINRQHHEEARQLLKQQNAVADKCFSELNKQYRDVVDNRRRALDLLEGIENFPRPTKPIVLRPPTMAVSPAVTVVDSAEHLGFLQITFSTDENTISEGEIVTKQVEAKYFFQWLNTSNYAAVLDANADVELYGTLRADAHTDFLTGGHAQLKFDAYLEAYIGGNIRGWTHSTISSASVEVDAAWPVGSLPDKKYFDSVTNLSYRPLAIESGQIVTFLVTIRASYRVAQGSVYFHVFVWCPDLVAYLMSPPNPWENIWVSRPTGA